MRRGGREKTNKMVDATNAYGVSTLFESNALQNIGYICYRKYLFSPIFHRLFFSRIYISALGLRFACQMNEHSCGRLSFYPFLSFSSFFSLSNTDNSILIFLFLFKLLFVQYIIRFLYMHRYSYIRDSYLLVECML